MKKILIGTSILAVSLFSFSASLANHHGEEMGEGKMHSSTMFYDNSEYGIFTQFAKKDLSEEEKNELKAMIKKRKEAMPMMKKMIMGIKSGKLNKYEEFEKLVPKRKAMAEKMKTFMADKKGFEYLCMNHGDDLLAKMFADEKKSEKYKEKFEKTFKTKLEKLYSKKGKALEKMIHKFYHNSIDNKKSENFISMIRGLELVIEDIKEEIETENSNNSFQEYDFKDIAEFVKKDLTKMQKEALVELLGERANAQIKFKNMLKKAKENGTLEETFEIVKGKRAGCAKRFEMFLDENKVDDFNEYCVNMGNKLKSMFE